MTPGARSAARRSKLRRVSAITVPTIFLLGGLLFSGCATLPGGRDERRAEKMVDRFVEALDYNRPGDIYPLLLPAYRDMIDKEGFIANFAHERSYPYLTPLWIYADEIVFNEELSAGNVHCTVASRLPGETMEFRVVKENGRWWIDALGSIADGTYIVIFDKLK